MRRRVKRSPSCNFTAHSAAVGNRNGLRSQAIGAPSRHWTLTPPLSANLLGLHNLTRSARLRGPELEIFDGEDTFDRLLPMVECKIKQAPVDRHEQPLTPYGAKAANGSLWAHMYVGPEGI